MVSITEHAGTVLGYRLKIACVKQESQIGLSFKIKINEQRIKNGDGGKDIYLLTEDKFINPAAKFFNYK